MVKERLADLQEKREAAVQMYDAACTMLGIENEPEAPAGLAEDEGSEAEPLL